MADTQAAKGNLSEANAQLVLGCGGYGGVAFQIANTFSGTISFEGSVDGVNYRALLVTPTNSTTQVTTATSAGVWTANTVGLVAVRARMSSFSSGTADVAIRAAQASPGGSSSGGGGGGGTSSTFGDPFPATGTAAGFIDSGGNMAGGNLDASGYLKVNVAAGSSGNAAASATGAAVPADADYQGIRDSSGNLIGMAGTNLDYDTGAGTAAQTVFGIALPASGGPVAGGTTTNPLNVALVAGSAVVGHVITDTGSTTAVTQATAASLNATVVGTGTFAVQNTAATPAGSNVIGHVITDTGSTTAVTGNVTVVQGTATSLKAEVIGAGTAGTANAGVVTVQGIASMTPVIATGSGTAGSAATGVLTVQGIASMTKLLVTPDSVALPANQSVNVSQVNGVTTSTGTGAVGTGTIRVAVGTDTATIAGTAPQTGSGTATGALRVELANNGTGVLATVGTVTTVTAVTAISNALPAGTNLLGRVSASDETNTIYNGTTALTPKFAKISTSSSGASEVVAAVTSKKIRVTQVVLMANAAVNVKFQSHVTPTDLTGLLYLAANTGFAPGYDPTGHFETVSGEALDINLSGAQAVGGWLKYIEV